MNSVDKIKAARAANLSEDVKQKLLQSLEQKLVYEESIVIGCGSHFQNPKWNLTGSLECPYKDRIAVTEFLRSEGFRVKDYINRFGVNYGIEVSI